jgi:hypothetical protein
VHHHMSVMPGIGTVARPPEQSQIREEYGQRRVRLGEPGSEGAKGLVPIDPESTPSTISRFLPRVIDNLNVRPRNTWDPLVQLA